MYQGNTNALIARDYEAFKVAMNLTTESLPKADFDQLTFADALFFLHHKRVRQVISINAQKALSKVIAFLTLNLLAYEDEDDTSKEELAYEYICTAESHASETGDLPVLFISPFASLAGRLVSLKFDESELEVETLLTENGHAEHPLEGEYNFTD